MIEQIQFYCNMLNHLHHPYLIIPGGILVSAMVIYGHAPKLGKAVRHLFVAIADLVRALWEVAAALL